MSPRFALLAIALTFPSIAMAQRQQLAVMELEARNVTPLLAESATEAVVGALRELRVFKVISRSEVRQMLTIEREQTLLNGRCAQAQCLADVGNALGARYLVVGVVSALDREAGPFALKLQLFDMKKAEVVADQTRGDFPTARALLEALPAAAGAVVRPMLDKEQGFLELACRESGANVTVDGRLVGVTPLPMQRLGWGPHRVVVEKEGFIAWAKDVQIERNQATAETVALVPSPEFIDAWRSRNQRMRIAAWATTGLAIAGAGAAAFMQFGKAEPLFDRFRPLQQAFRSNQGVPDACGRASESLGEGDPQRAQIAGDSGACYAYAQDLSREGDQWQWAARGAGGLAALSAAAASYFWLAGDEPGRYDGYRTDGSSPLPQAGIVPISGGALATLQLSF